MWKSGWRPDREWIRKNEKWMVLFIVGLLFLVLSFSAGKPTGKEPYAGSPGLVERREEAVRSGTGEGASQAVSVDRSGRQYEKEIEKRIREILKNVEGVGEVDVMLTIRSSPEKIIHVDREKSRSSVEETDHSGGTRKQIQEEIKETPLTTGTGGQGEPVVEKELEPEIAGVIISAAGGDRAAVQKEISEAMQALFDLPAHKIKVLKRVE